MNERLNQIDIALAELKARENALRSKLSEIALEKSKLMLEKWEIEYGIKLGVTVKLKEGSRFVVVEIQTKYDWVRKPWVMGNPIKKDGKKGIAVRHLYSEWEVVT